MKKVLLVILLILLTGCFGRKKVVCTIPLDEELKEFIEKVEVIGYLDKQDIVEEAEVKYYFKEGELIESLCQYYGCDKNNILIINTKDDKNRDLIFDDLVLELNEGVGLPKENFINFIKEEEDSNIVCK